MADQTPRIYPLDIRSEMEKSFISYAMAVITNRALPDVRDGLKPVHRRILYAMDELGLAPDKPYRKSARIVGDVLGKYHPHGDSSIYDAMVRLAQDFNTRYPLVQGHGNFGSVDGDSAAAMRYTEARFSKVAVEMIADIERNTVDFVPNFDETLLQPSVMPARYPNVLVNGSGGIAVGMATNIPPHNLGEVVDALCALIDDPDISIDELMKFMPGPDFPTGAVIMGRSGIASAYHTGRGRIVVRAKAEIEQLDNNKSRIVITEIPYQVNKARMVERIAELVHEKKIEGIAVLRDETDRTGMRIVIDLKRDVNANVVLNLLYKHTQMQDTFGVIMLMLVDGEPRIINLKEILYHYLQHQKDVVTRRTQYELTRAQERQHLLEGLLKALDHIDEIVDLIKKSPNPAEAKVRLIERFVFSERQAQAIIDMRLGRLTGMERDKMQAEYDELTNMIAYLNSILADVSVLLGIIRDEARAVQARLSDARRTEISDIIEDIDMDDIIQEEDMCVTLTHFGYVKRLSLDTYRAQNRGGRGIIGQGTREEDFVENIFVTSTHSQIMFYTNRGRAFRIKCYVIPEVGRAAKGTAIVNLLQLQGGERISAAFPAVATEDGHYLVMATRQGVIKKTPLSDFANIRRGGLIALNLREDDELVSVELSSGDDEFIVATRQGKCIRFHENDVRAMSRVATGVRSIRLNEDDAVIGMVRVVPGQDVLTVSERGMGKRTNEESYRGQKRGGKGIIAMQVTDKTGELCGISMVHGGEDLMLIRDDGMVIRMGVDQISVTQSRGTQGVRLMRAAEGTRVVSIAIAPRNEEEAVADTETAPAVTTSAPAFAPIDTAIDLSTDETEEALETSETEE